MEEKENDKNVFYELTVLLNYKKVGIQMVFSNFPLSQSYKDVMTIPRFSLKIKQV